MDELQQLRPGQILAKDFRVVRALAAGGMGSVYLVEQLSTGRERALKVMHPQYVRDAESRARFAQEARVGARIKSEHVVDVVSAGVDEETGIPWLAMELLDGEELELLVLRQGRLQPKQTLEIFRQLCHGLGEAHRAGLVHRDLKPQNIFIARSRRRAEQDFTVKILDFGVAKLVQEKQGLSDSTRPVGTPRWMAPEQSDSGAQIRPNTDVWPLGLLAFNLLTGKHYWRSANSESSNLTALLRELIMEPIVAATKRASDLGVPDLPPAFDAWFARCVVREQESRYPDATAALEALVPLLESAPEVVIVPPARPRPPSFPQVDTPNVDGATVYPAKAPSSFPLPASPPGLDPEGETRQSGRLALLPAEESTHRQSLPPPPPGAPQRSPGPDTLRWAGGAQRSGENTNPNHTPAAGAQPLDGRTTGPATGTAGGAVATALAAPAGATPAAPAGSRAPLAVGAVVLVVVGALVLALFKQRLAAQPAPVRPAPVSPVAAAPPALPDSFTVVFDSFPSGANVLEGEAVLGTTPMQLTLENKGLAAQPRKFRLERAGFRSYSVVQGPSSETVKVLATLSADPDALAQKPAPPRPAAAKRHRPGAPDDAADGEPVIRTRR